MRALSLDCLESTHPIEVEVSHASEIGQIFDDISYRKGASVLRMLYSYIGDENFRTGMNLYLKRHQYGNAKTEDLWVALEEASNKSIGDMMSTWTRQGGFPFIEVEKQQECLQLTQSRFLLNEMQNYQNERWIVSIMFSERHIKFFRLIIKIPKNQFTFRYLLLSQHQKTPTQFIVL